MPLPQRPLEALAERTAKRVAAAMGGSMAGGLATLPIQTRLTRGAFKKPYEGWQDASTELAKAMDVGDVPVFTSSRMRGNAFFSPVGLNKRMVDALGIGMWDKLTKDPKAKHGVIVMGKEAPSAVLAHEMGHATQHKGRGAFGRKAALPFQNIMSALSLFGALAGAVYGKKIPGLLGRVLSRRSGALRRIGSALKSKIAPYIGGGVGGLGTGYAMNYPRLAEEHGASEKAQQAISKLRGTEAGRKALKRLTKAYRTYQLGALTSTLAGTVPGVAI
jgi:hypothetical protein